MQRNGGQKRKKEVDNFMKKRRGGGGNKGEDDHLIQLGRRNTQAKRGPVQGGQLFPEEMPQIGIGDGPRDPKHSERFSFVHEGGGGARHVGDFRREAMIGIIIQAKICHGHKTRLKRVNRSLLLIE